MYPYVKKVIETVVGEQMSFVITPKNNDNEVAHAMISHDLQTKIDFSNLQFSEYRKTVMATVSTLYNKFKSEHGHEGFGNILYMSLGSTADGHHSQGLQTWSIQETIERAKDRGYQMAAMTTTNPVNSRTAVKLGFEEYDRVDVVKINPSTFSHLGDSYQIVFYLIRL
ncbi:hypothetical protein AKO1_008048 [Acrasis kona]|uniref:N-acetyltransferase domain-containing protein n=1 Tax=Acrasis kona TaxID=1008807 RepID=A0AAW2YRE1_9EUKA